MKSKLIAAKVYDPDNQPEEHIESLRFVHHKFTRRSKPNDPRRILIIPVFGEFGCEIVASMYLIPRLVQKFPGYYSIIMGWGGREYLYRHLADEFWELGEEFQWLREYCRAFHHDSVNLKRFENKLKGKEGYLVTPNYMGRQVLGTECLLCGAYWREESYSEKCRACSSREIRRALFHDMPACWENVSLPPKPCLEKMAWARDRLPDNPVGIFARARKCYGRNLPSKFYQSLINRLRDSGYNPIWLGEPSTTLICPDKKIPDFSRMPEQRDLETTLAIVSQLKFTVQFWTASTRIAAMVGTPYILFESPDQMWGNGQEGYRLELITRGGPRKLVANHYLSVLNDPERGLDILDRSIKEVEAGDFSDTVGLVEEPAQVQKQMIAFQKKVKN